MQSLSNNRRGLAKPRFEPRIAWSQQTFVRITPGGSPMTESTAGAGVHGNSLRTGWRKPCRAQGTIAGDGSSMSRGSHAKPDRDDVPELLRRPAPAAPERYRAAPGTGSRGSPTRDPAAPARPLPRSSGSGNPVAMATAALPLRAPGTPARRPRSSLPADRPERRRQPCGTGRAGLSAAGTLRNAGERLHRR